ncbi:ribonuclease H-like domain-containing protein [Tanacetum coccineum]
MFVSSLGTVDFGLQLYASVTTSLVGYTDADWVAKRQHTLSRSSVEAEYRVVANVVAETTWLRNLLRELHSPLSIATLVYYDNVSAVYMSVNPVEHQRTKHIEIDIHFVRDMVTARQVRVLHVLSRYQYADIFTKGLPLALFDEFRSSLSVHPAPTAGAVVVEVLQKSFEEFKQARTRDKELFEQDKEENKNNMMKDLSLMR